MCALYYIGSQARKGHFIEKKARKTRKTVDLRILLKKVWFHWKRAFFLSFSASLEKEVKRKLAF